MPTYRVTTAITGTAVQDIEAETKEDAMDGVCYSQWLLNEWTIQDDANKGGFFKIEEIEE